VFGHHPQYTRSRDHGIEGDCLRVAFFDPSNHRNKKYSLGYFNYDNSNNKNPNSTNDDNDAQNVNKNVVGFGLEDVLVNGNVDAYFSGHEHLFEYHYANGIHHFMCGSAGTSGVKFYGGEDQSRELTWYDNTKSKYGFVGVTIVDDTNMKVTYYDAPSGSEIYTVNVKKS